MENKTLKETSDKIIDPAAEAIIVPMEAALGPFALPARKVGKMLGSGIIKAIDKLFDKCFE